MPPKKSTTPTTPPANPARAVPRGRGGATTKPSGKTPAKATAKAPAKNAKTPAVKKRVKVQDAEAVGLETSNDLMSLMMQTGTLASRGQILHESKYLEAQDYRFSSQYPAIDLALSGLVRGGGMSKGVLMLAGPSKHFKSKYGVILLAEFLRNNPDGIAFFYDNEGGTRKSYFRAHGVDMKRVIHIPFMNLEELRNDMVQKYEKLPPDAKVFSLVDSLGTSGSKKEMEDVLKDEYKGEVARAKVVAGFARLISPYHVIKNIFTAIVNHTYMTIGNFTKEVMGGGGKAELIANDIWFFQKQAITEKSVDNAEGKDVNVVVGNMFYIVINKSRVVTAGRKIPIQVDYKGGIAKYTGMLDIAKQLGIVDVRSGGSKGNVAEYCNTQTGELISAPVKEKLDGEGNIIWPAIERNAEFWEGVFDTTDFVEACLDEYTFDGRSSVLEEDAELVETLSSIDSVESTQLTDEEIAIAEQEINAENALV